MKGNSKSSITTTRPPGSAFGSAGPLGRGVINVTTGMMPRASECSALFSVGRNVARPAGSMTPR